MDREVFRTAAVLIVGALAVVFDTTITSIALPTLVLELHSSVATIQWVSTGYLLALGVVIPLVAWAQARTGGKRLWMIALTVFLIGSILCSLAWDAPIRLRDIRAPRNARHGLAELLSSWPRAGERPGMAS